MDTVDFMANINLLILYVVSKSLWIFKTKNMENLIRLKNGKLVEATPLDMCCEFGEANNNGSCDNTNVKDYVRNENDCDGSDWDEEPICLCEINSVGHKLYVEND